MQRRALLIVGVAAAHHHSQEGAAEMATEEIYRPGRIVLGRLAMRI
jgi:hypothetical protein